MGGEFVGLGSSTCRSRLKNICMKRERGTIYLDILLGLCLSLFILAVPQQLMGLVYEIHNNNYNRAELQYSARMALDCIQRDIRCARDFQVNGDGSKLTIVGAEGETIRIFVQNHNLYRQDVSNNPVAENMAAIHFNKSAAALQCQLELEDSESRSYALDFFCFARAQNAQD